MEKDLEEKVCGCETEGICNCAGECGCNKPIAEASITDLTPKELTPEEAIAKRKKEYEDYLVERRKADEAIYYPQLKQRGVDESRFHIFADIMEIIRKQRHTETIAVYTYNIISAGILEGWDAMKATMRASLDKLEEGSESYKLRNALFDDILAVVNYMEDSNMSADELNYLSKFMKHHPIVALTGSDDEWMSLERFGDNDQEQSRLHFSVFRKKGDSSTAYTVDGAIYSMDGGLNYAFRSGDANNVNEKFISPQLISFPYVVPDRPQFKCLEEISDGEYIDITDNEERIKFLADYFTKVYSYEGAALSFVEACTKVNKNTRYRSILTDQHILIYATDKGIAIANDKRDMTFEIDRFTRFIAEDCSLPDNIDESGSNKGIECEDAINEDTKDECSYSEECKNCSSYSTCEKIVLNESK